MTDVNYVKYGIDAVNMTYAADPFTSFLATNGYAIGSVLAIVVILFIIAFVIVFGFTKLKKLIPR